MVHQSSDLNAARKILVEAVLRLAPLYYEQQFTNNNYYGVGVDADGSVHGFGCADDVEGHRVDELSLIDLGGLLENDDPEYLTLYEQRKQGQNEFAICLREKRLGYLPSRLLDAAGEQLRKS
jgi:hypothetical protein